MATLSQAEAQYENRFDAKCECGESLWRRIEWAYNQNNRKMQEMRFMLRKDWENPNAPLIVILYCKNCSDKRKNMTF